MIRFLMTLLCAALLSGGASASDIRGLVPFTNAMEPGTLSLSSGRVAGTPLMLQQAIGKTLAPWAAGDGGGLDIAGSIPAGAGGHIFVICCDPVTGKVDALLSASAYNPKLPDGYTQKQIINSFLTDAGGNVAQGNWRSDGTFELSLGRWPVQAESLINLHLVPTGMPAGTKIEGHFRIVAWDTGPNNYGFYGFLKDPDAYPVNRYPPYPAHDWNTFATYDKVAGINWSTRVTSFGDEMGQVLNGSASGSGATTFQNHVYLQGWRHPREADAPTVSIGILGASLTMDRNANNWPNVVAAELQQGKYSRVRVLLAGKEGTASNFWMSSGWVATLARVRPHLVILDMTADANPGQGITVAQSLSNLYAIVDAIRANNPDVPIFLFMANRMRADAAQFANVLAYYANYAVVQANRLNIHILDTYTPWGDAAMHPEEYSAADPIHPLFAGNRRVSIPVSVSIIAPFVQ